MEAVAVTAVNELSQTDDEGLAARCSATTVLITADCSATVATWRWRLPTPTCA
jgi:hypothetical protein